MRPLQCDTDVKTHMPLPTISRFQLEKLKGKEKDDRIIYILFALLPQ